MRAVRWKRMITLVALTETATLGTLSGQQPLWVRHNTLGNTARAMLVDSAGYIYVTGQGWRQGTGNDFVTVKYDPDGNLVWQHAFSGETIAFDDHAAAIAEDQAGNVIVTGQVDVVRNNTPGTGYATLKYLFNSTGTPTWGRRYMGSQQEFPSNAARAIATDFLSNVYVTGMSRGNDSAEDIVTVSYGPTGNERWVRRYAGGGYSQDWGNAIKVNWFTGEIYVTGKTGNFPVLIKYSSGSSELWTAIEGSFPGEARAIALDTSGNIYIAGLHAWDTRNYFISKYNSAGTRLWNRVYDGGGHDDVAALAVDVDGNAYVTGTSQGTDTGNDYTTVKYDTNGNLQWVQRYHSGDDRASGLAVSFFTGDVYITGRSDNKIATLKYDTNGNLQWVRRYEHRNGAGIGVGLYEYELGIPTVYVVGTTQSDYTIIKYPPCYVVGDVDGNCCVDDADLLLVLFDFGQTGIDLQGDLNSDGTVDDADLLTVLFNFGSGC
ncbi:MAG: hypothetical protein WHS44_01715 [Fimbriimonadales bacterium]|nr:MAG: hypothetical protein KatS3mg018_0606 [Fimbriimonadales bacterium]